MWIPTARSYCTGYTGLEMAVRASFGDFQVLSHSDIKPASTVLLKHYYPNIPNLGNMRTIDYEKLEAPDLMIGSWPCQPHSSAGWQLGENDYRDLWPEYLRAIDAHRPTFFFGENVARIATNGELRRVVLLLAERGYVGAWRCIRASDIGACHKRERCFIVAFAPDRIKSTYLPKWNNCKHLENLENRHTLLPTPREQRAGPRLSGGINLQAAIMNLHPYVNAIRHHERIANRLAPEPKQLSEITGKSELTARFVEWMMMLPNGWVTTVPNLVDNPRKSERNAMISLLGDGVVPAQGAFAFRFLLARLAARLSSDQQIAS